jgi:hypothetical protein
MISAATGAVKTPVGPGRALRTDLSGVYFNAVFIAGVSLVYLAIGHRGSYRWCGTDWSSGGNAATPFSCCCPFNDPPALGPRSSYHWVPLQHEADRGVGR